MGRAINYSFGENFIDKLADFLLEACGNKQDYDFSRICCVFEGKRPVLFLCKKLSQRIKKPFLPPKFFSIDEFVEYIAARAALKRLSSLDNAYLIYSLVRKYAPSLFKSSSDFSEFLPWAKEIASFIEQLDLEDIKDDSLRAVEKSAAIGYDVPKSINDLLEHIVKIRNAYHKALTDKNIYSRGFTYLKASQKARGMSFDEFDKVVFCGFFYLYATQERIIKEACALEKGVYIFQGSQQNWPVLKDNLKKIGLAAQASDPEPEFNLCFYQGFDLHSQICIVREILNSRIKDKNNTLIVVPRPEAVIPLLSEIFPVLEEFNVSMGYPLKRSPVYVLLNSLLKAQESRKDGCYYTKDYLSLLRHPLVKNLNFRVSPVLTRVMIHKIEELARGARESSIGGSLFLSLEQIEKEEKVHELTVETLQGMDVAASIDDCKAALKELHNLLFYAWDKVDDFSSFAAGIENLVDVLAQKSSFTRFRFNLKVIEKLQEIKDEFKNVSFSGRKFSRFQIWDIFRRQLESEMVAFKGSPLRGAQILGLLEARSLNFENIIVIDVNESVLPKLKIYEPLIPREVELSLGLKRLEKEEQIQRYHFMRLIWNAKNVHLVYEENQAKEKSRFIEELLWQQQKQAKKLEAMGALKGCFALEPAGLPESVKKTAQMVEFLKQQVYSASRINTYLSCPLQFYYQYVLGLKEKEDLLDEPAAPHIGNFIHELLEEAFGEFKGSRPIISEKFKKRFFQRLEEKFEKEISGRMKSDSFLLKGIIINRMEKFLDNEAERSPARVICLEERRQGRMAVNGRTLDFVYTVDRIDELKDGSIVILDYKTGSGGYAPKKLSALENIAMDRKSIKENIKSFQLPLYYYFVSKEFPEAEVSAQLYNIRTLKRETFIHKADFSKKEDVLKVNLKALCAVFAEIFNPDVPFEPDKQESRCVFCDFKDLCE